MKTCDLIISIENGLVLMEDMSPNARKGLHRDSPIKSTFYFMAGEYNIVENETTYSVTGHRCGLYVVDKGQVVESSLLVEHEIPRDRFQSVYSSPIDFFRTLTRHMVSYERVIIPLKNARKYVKLIFPKQVTTILSQDQWEVTSGEDSHGS